jgi:hypothetical protein
VSGNAVSIAGKHFALGFMNAAFVAKRAKRAGMLTIMQMGHGYLKKKAH